MPCLSWYIVRIYKEVYFSFLSSHFFWMSQVIQFCFLSDSGTPSQIKWSIVMEDIFGEKTSNGVILVRFP